MTAGMTASVFKSIKCSRCRQDKPSTEFSVDRAMKSGYRSYCRPCANEYNKGWRVRNPEKALEYSRRYAKLNPVVYNSEQRKQRYQASGWNYNLVKQYGITEAEFYAMLDAQGGGCAICGRRDSGVRGRRMSVDHCHKCKKVRGILCGNCNQAIGKLDDDPDRMLAAATYILRHTDVLATLLEEVTA